MIRERFDENKASGHWRQECGQAANLMVMELQPSHDLLAEIFFARPEDIRGIIKSRLAEWSWREEHEWPATALAS